MDNNGQRMVRHVPTVVSKNTVKKLTFNRTLSHMANKELMERASHGEVQSNAVYCDSVEFNEISPISLK